MAEPSAEAIRSLWRHRLFGRRRHVELFKQILYRYSLRGAYPEKRGLMAEARNMGIAMVIADKSPLVQTGLDRLFGRDDRFTLLATAADGERFMEAVDRLSFDIGVIGWDMPYLDGRGVLQALRACADPPRIVVYTGNAAPDVPRQVMHLGGAGFCSKGDPPERLVETVLAVSTGRMVFPFMDLGTVEADPFDSLTQRERELLTALARGCTNAQIARELDISLNTVKFHLKNLYGKLDVRNRAQAVACHLKAHGRI